MMDKQLEGDPPKIINHEHFPEDPLINSSNEDSPLPL
jgi:hypothetical protein